MQWSAVSSQRRALNFVLCTLYFELNLKEGLTVYRNMQSTKYKAQSTNKRKLTTDHCISDIKARPLFLKIHLIVRLLSSNPNRVFVRGRSFLKGRWHEGTIATIAKSVLCPVYLVWCKNPKGQGRGFVWSVLEMLLPNPGRSSSVNTTRQKSVCQ